MDKDSVKVFLRLKPNNFKDEARVEDAENKLTSSIDIARSTDRMIVINKTPYTFDHIFCSSTTQMDIFHEMVS